jgi:hypothetical protein
MAATVRNSPRTRTIRLSCQSNFTAATYQSLNGKTLEKISNAWQHPFWLVIWPEGLAGKAAAG